MPERWTPVWLLVQPYSAPAPHLLVPVLFAARRSVHPDLLFGSILGGSAVCLSSFILGGTLALGPQGSTGQLCSAVKEASDKIYILSFSTLPCQAEQLTVQPATDASQQSFLAPCQQQCSRDKQPGGAVKTDAGLLTPVCKPAESRRSDGTKKRRFTSHTNQQ